VVPRILLATDGTLTHILEAYADEPVHLVKLSHDLMTDPALRAMFDLDQDERALRRVILLRGTKTDTTFVHADSVVMLDRLPASVATGLLDTDIPIGKLLYSCRAETCREILTVGQERDAVVASHFGAARAERLLFRTYQILLEGRPVARITERFPKAAFPETLP
jgi:chorismate-pyruvate lyase